MIQGTIDRIFEVLGDNRKVVMIVVLCFIAYPFATTGWLLAERSGKMTNIYQVEHADIRKKQEDLDFKFTTMTENVNIISRSVISGTSASQDVAFFLQKICVKQMKTDAERDECMVPKWRRTLEVKP